MSSKEKTIFNKTFKNIMEAWDNLEYEENKWSYFGLYYNSKVLYKENGWNVKIELDGN